jgi:hypothetical protein
MNQKYWKTLDSAGLPAEIVENLKRAPRINEVDRAFCVSAERALVQAGYKALGFLASNPGASKVELAKRLKDCNAVGLTMAIYEEAKREGTLRETAKELLVREISNTFPLGWESSSGMKIWSWVNDIEKYVDNAADNGYAERIVKELAIDHPPASGWKPDLGHDSLIDDLFDRHWPIERKS